MKKHLGLIIFLIIIIALVVVAIVFSEDETEYIKEISLNDVIDKQEDKDSFILYIKQTDCEHCKEFTPTLMSVLRENDIKAYALNLTNLTEEENEIYTDTFDVNGTPTVLFFDEGNESLIRIEGAQSKAKVESKLESTGFIK